MRIVADAYIPFLKGLLDDVADVVYLSPDAIDADAIKEADALIIRTRTKCNADLLKGSNVRFIATATIGYDHIDTNYCAHSGITWTNCPGCNANSVVNYMYAVLTTLFPEGLSAKKLGIVGVGNVGSRVAKMAHNLGMTVLLNDPPRAKNEPNIPFLPLSELQQQCDIITFHVPLASDTYHMVNADFLRNCTRTPLIINAARGEVCDTQALLDYTGNVVLDCWENEPNISLPLLDKVLIGTPHIAGYSVDGKANGTRMATAALCRFFDIKKEINITIPGKKGIAYCVQAESDALKAHPELFEAFRNNYPLRRDNLVFD